jgi:hypothetical protein
MYEVIKLENPFYGKAKKEIKNTYPRLEVNSERDYDKEMIELINMMLHVYIFIIF